MSNIFDSLEKRRSQYGLGKESGVSNEAIVELVKKGLDLTPTAFNAQTQRVVILFGEESDRFWDNTRDELKKVAPAEGFEKTIEKLNSFKAGQGTLLFYTDMDVTRSLQENFPLYADNFPIWGQQENGMLQLVIWSAFADLGLGANIQHYNPVVDDITATTFDIPNNWQLVAQMPFGQAVGEVGPKDTASAADKIKVF